MSSTPQIVGGTSRATLIDGRWVLSANRHDVVQLVAAVAERDGETPRRWVVADAAEDDTAAAGMAGLGPVRDVFQLRRPLPVEPEARARYPAIDVRAFRPGTDDEAAWLACNNRAFASHPDQAGFTVARLHRLMAELWFEPAGFLLHESAGELAGFCWTKVHDHEQPPLGEIFVIGVDPAHAGSGLGGSLTLAGLQSLSQRGLRVGMLYVDEDNATARRMYERLGFTVHHIDRIYESRPDNPSTS